MGRIDVVGPNQWNVVARVGGGWHSDEHTGSGGISNLKYWSRSWNTVAGFILDNGVDGSGDYIDDDPVA